MAESTLCKNSSILRLHYHSIADNIALKSTDSPPLPQFSSKMQCKFCYSISPKLKVISRNNHKNKKSRAKRYKNVRVLCGVCHIKYPSNCKTKLEQRTRAGLDKNLVIPKSENKKTNDMKVCQKKPKKKRHKDVNAGLILPNSTSTSNDLNIGIKSTGSSKPNLSNKNDKLLQMLKKSEKQKISYSKLDMFLK